MRRTTAEKCAIFRALHDEGCFAIPNPWDVGSARYLQGLGFKALATTSSGFAWTRGQSDGTPSIEDTLAHLRSIVEATDLPVNADFEDGFGTSIAELETNVKRAIETGIAGLSIEDSTGNPQSPVYDLDVAVERLHATRRVIDAAGGHVLLVGRAENFISGRPDLEDTITRLKAYSEAGADCLYAPGISTRDQITAVVSAVAPKPFNLLVGATNELRIQDFAALGVRRVSVGGALARVAWGGFIKAARSLAESGRFDGFAGATSNQQMNSFFKISQEAPLMDQPAHIVGKVQYRAGEGPLQDVPIGTVDIQTTETDAIITWPEAGAHGIAAMPVADLCQYIADGLITMAVKPSLAS